MRKTCAIVICLGFLLQAAANTGVVSAAFLKDTLYKRNNNAAVFPSSSPARVSGELPSVGLDASSATSLNIFRVALNYDKVLIIWSTAREHNVKYYTVERSTDGINYNFLGFMVAGDKQSEQNEYRLTDNAPTDGMNYYRLSQTDREGRISYFGSRIVNKNSKDFSSGIINFANGNIRMIINSGKRDDLNLNLVDISGHEVRQETFSVATGSTSKTFVLPKGTYVAMLSNQAGERCVNKIVVQ